MKVRLYITVILAVTLCGGCSTLTSQEVASAYTVERGPHAVVSIKRAYLQFAALDKELPMRLAYPADGGPYPVIIFSHGNGCSQDLYADIADHWASWGYVVIQPVHMDSRDLGFSMKGKTLAEMNQVVSSRPADMRFILDSFAELEQQVPGLAGKLDSERLIAAGHSMGGGTAMTLTGVAMVNPRDKSIMQSDENRFDVLVLITEPSNNRMMPDEPWRLANVPSFVATGSNDFSFVGAKNGTKSKSAWQLPAGTLQPDEPRWYLFVNDADHFLGGLICKDTAPGPADYEALGIWNAASTIFMDAYIKNDPVAQAFLQSGDIEKLTNQRATFENLQ